ncbi:MAG TPA: redoxin domain-containing protein [Gemmatimonadales bacterium]|nr:redoxin domain-containing protein [Gemmatimonadales bacterium]
MSWKAGAPLPPGTTAPDFTLPSSPRQPVSLADFRGRLVVLAFYPADWSPVCGDQLALYSSLRDEFERLGAEVLGISVDGPWCHAAYTEARRLRLTLLADFEPKGEVSRRYGVYDEAEGTSGRALFVIDGDGTIRWSYRSPDEVNPGADGILEALEGLQARTAGKGGTTA